MNDGTSAFPPQVGIGYNAFWLRDYEYTLEGSVTSYSYEELTAACHLFVRFSTVAGERGAADAERDIRGFAIKFFTEEGNWDLVGNNTPVFFLRDPLKFPDLNHAVKRDPKTNMRSARNNWDFWTSLPDPRLPSGWCHAGG